MQLAIAKQLSGQLVSNYAFGRRKTAQKNILFHSDMVIRLAPHFYPSIFSKINWDANSKLQSNGQTTELTKAKLTKNLGSNIKPYFIYTSAGNVTELTVNYKTTKNMSPYILREYERKVILIIIF